jgi:hypothetical protein
MGSVTPGAWEGYTRPTQDQGESLSTTTWGERIYNGELGKSDCAGHMEGSINTAESVDKDTGKALCPGAAQAAKLQSLSH